MDTLLKFFTYPQIEPFITIIGVLLLIVIPFPLISIIWRFLTNYSPRKELMRALLKDRNYIEANDIHNLSYNLFEHYKLYKYHTLFPDAVCEMTKEESIKISQNM
ncbi:hypothetical protein [Arsenophonus sp. PmNCSU2021_1]|uniref:hypothetical protein n=1 Tax=Arsenophonus sp. PmNCSU2021_1 TaxID=3118989 RepID=UPI002FF36C5A